MTERPAFDRLGEIAGKWRDLAEARRHYFEQLYRSGRWKRYYSDDQLLARMREVIASAERWQQIAPRDEQATGQAAALAFDGPSAQRDAA